MINNNNNYDFLFTLVESLDLFGEVAGNTHYLPFVGNIVQEIRDRRKRSHFYVSRMF